MNDESIYEGKLHYIIFVWPVAITLFGLLVLYFLPMLKIPGIIFLIAGIINGLLFYGAYKYSFLQIKKNSLQVQTGVFTRQNMTIPFSKIETVDIRQSILGALLNYGSIIIIGTGGTKNFFQNISEPLTCRRNIEQRLYDK